MKIKKRKTGLMKASLLKAGFRHHPEQLQDPFSRELSAQTASSGFDPDFIGGQNRPLLCDANPYSLSGSLMNDALRTSAGQRKTKLDLRTRLPRPAESIGVKLPRWPNGTACRVVQKAAKQ
jgi:hypothetical protein